MIKNIKSRTIVTAVLLCFSMLSQAKVLMCPYNDKFTISGPAQTKILNAIPQGNVYYSQKSDTLFTLDCADSSGLDGELQIKIGTDLDNQCTLIVRDGPWEMNASVTNFYCNGKMQYLGMDHQTWSRDYTLQFSA